MEFLIKALCGLALVLVVAFFIVVTAVAQESPITIEHRCGALANTWPTLPASAASTTSPGIALAASEAPDVIVVVGSNCAPCTAWLRDEFPTCVHTGLRILVIQSDSGPVPRFRVRSPTGEKTHVGYLKSAALRALSK